MELKPWHDRAIPPTQCEKFVLLFPLHGTFFVTPSEGGHMAHIYIPYLRTADGTIRRVADAFFDSPDDRLGPFLHEEPLSGWPETKVLWAKKFGPTVGFALSANPSPD
jgi:hypothetical protein